MPCSCMGFNVPTDNPCVLRIKPLLVKAEEDVDGARDLLLPVVVAIRREYF